MTSLPLEISCEEVQSLLQSENKPLLIDCREPDEHAISRLSEAQLIPMQQIPGSLKALQASVSEAPEAALIVYCHHGMRSAQTANWLRENGLPQAQSMAGGIDAWSDRIDPSVQRY